MICSSTCLYCLCHVNLKFSGNVRFILNQELAELGWAQCNNQSDLGGGGSLVNFL